MGENNEDLELEEQLATLGVDLGGGTKVKAPEPVQQVVQQPQQSIPQPYTPENPTNAGVVTNNIVQQTPMQQVMQEQVNQQAQAQVVHTTTTAGNPVTQPVKPAQPSRPTPTQPTDEPVFIDLARAVRTQQTPWMRLKDNEWSRILVLDLAKVIPMKLHYIKGLGWVQCLSSYTPEGWLDQPAGCCKKFGPNGEVIPRLDENGNELKAKNRYLVPVIEYPVDKSNGKKIIPGQLPQLKMWTMNAVEWGDLINRVQAIADDPDDLYSVDLSHIDFLLHKDASKRYSTIDINPMPTSFRDNFEANIQEEASKFTKEFYTTALKEARKIVSEETIVNAYASQEAENAMVNNMMNEGYGNQQLGI